MELQGKPWETGGWVRFWGSISLKKIARRSGYYSAQIRSLVYSIHVTSHGKDKSEEGKGNPRHLGEEAGQGTESR